MELLKQWLNNGDNMKINEAPQFLMICGKTERISPKRIKAIRKIKKRKP
jgi:hypothetical protein